MFELKITSHFAAAHQLAFIGSKKCEQLHGHNWKVEVCIIGEELDQSGILLDFSLLKKHLKNILERLDHKFLNDLNLLDNGNPSSENIAVYVTQQMQNKINKEEITVSKVSVWESQNACATYYPSNK